MRTLTVVNVATLSVNGVEELQAIVAPSGGGEAGCPMMTIPVGLTLPAGNVVTIEDSAGSAAHGRAWGYLANQ